MLGSSSADAFIYNTLKQSKEPPWSSGQKSSGDDNPRSTYPHIEQRVRDTYVKRQREVTSKAAGGNAAGNLYVQAIRWASDRLPRNRPGVIAFIHPNSLTTATSLAGARATLRDEFTDIYVVNLRGDAMKSGEEFRREGDKIFGQGSRNGVQITVLVRNPAKAQNEPAELRYAEVPEYSALHQKFDWLEGLSDVTSDAFETVPVNDTHDWVNTTDSTFETMMPVCSSDKKDVRVASSRHASGVKTNCDAYVYSFSRDDLINKMKCMIDAYEDARELHHDLNLPFEECTANTDLTAIKWTETLKQSLKKGDVITFDETRIREVLYRPFTKLWLYEDHRILSRGKPVSAMFPRESPGGCPCLFVKSF